MEEDVKPEDEDGVDGRGVYGWDGWVCGLGAVGASLVFGLVRGSGALVVVLPTFVLVSRIQFAQRSVWVSVGLPLCLDRVGCQWGYHC